MGKIVVTVVFRDGSGVGYYFWFLPVLVLIDIIADDDQNCIDWKQTLAPVKRAWVKWWWRHDNRDRLNR